MSVYRQPGRPRIIVRATTAVFALFSSILLSSFVYGIERREGGSVWARVSTVALLTFCWMFGLVGCGVFQILA